MYWTERRSVCINPHSRRPRRILTSLTFTPKEPQFGPVRSLLGKDFIAGRDLQKYPLIVDGLVHRGNSGGPVVEMDVDFPVTRHYVVGVSIQFIPLAETAPDFELRLNSGYSVAEPMDYVLEIIGKNWDFASVNGAGSVLAHI
jgi:hypothetical protein